MRPDDTLPKLRWPLEVQAFEHQTKQLIYIRDTIGYTVEIVYLPIECAALLQFFNGYTSVREVLAASGISIDTLTQITSLLERAFFLENEASNTEIQRVVDEFASTRKRLPALNGSVYPETESALTDYLRRLAQSCPSSFSTPAPGTEAIGFCAPHIDYARGSTAYAATLVTLSMLKPADVVILLGTAHQPSQSRFVVSDKSFSTPLGELVVEDLSCRRLRQLYPASMLRVDEFIHKNEHSLELQLPLLQYTWGCRPKIVPILVGSFYDCLEQSRIPIEIAEVSAFVDCLSQEVHRLQAQGLRVMIYCGVDLSHCGQHFGDSQPLGKEQRSQIGERDSMLLETIAAAESEQLFAHMAEDLDARRVCGFPSLYTMLAVFEQLKQKVRGELFSYEQAFDEPADCLVSFAAMHWQAMDCQRAQR